MVAGMPEFRRLVMMMANECNADHTKVNALLTVLMAHFAGKKDDRVLVFANTRATEEVLVERLKEREYRAVLFVGKGRRKGHRLVRRSITRCSRFTGRIRSTYLRRSIKNCFIK
jgi:ERCC4-related helicase